MLGPEHSRREQRTFFDLRTERPGEGSKHGPRRSVAGRNRGFDPADTGKGSSCQQREEHALAEALAADVRMYRHLPDEQAVLPTWREVSRDKPDRPPFLERQNAGISEMVGQQQVSVSGIDIEGRAGVDEGSDVAAALDGGFGQLDGWPPG